MSIKHNKSPKISIISPSFNTGRFMEETIQSILKQSFTNYEHIIVDGASTDNTLSILKKYPHIRWVSEKDSGYHEALLKGVKMSKGEYIMICMISDGYVNKDWLKICSEVLDKDLEVSLVWGFPQWMNTFGKLTHVSYPHFKTRNVPQKYDWLPYWLMTGDGLPNGNFCVRKEVFVKCNPILKETTKGQEFFDFNFNFNRNGYLPYNIPVIADFGREHPGQLSQLWSKNNIYKKGMERYFIKIANYRRELLSGKTIHIFRDGKSKKLKREPSLRKVTTINSYYQRFMIMAGVIIQRGPYKISQYLKKRK